MNNGSSHAASSGNSMIRKVRRGNASANASVLLHPATKPKSGKAHPMPADYRMA